MIQRMLIMLIAVGALAGGVYLLKRQKAEAMQSAMASMRAPTVTVTTAEAALEPWQPQVKGVASLAPVLGVDVTCELAGLVRSVEFASGDHVEQGQLLVQLVSDTDEALLAQLQADVDLARQVLERDQAQLEARAVSQATLDNDQADLKVKQAKVSQQQALIAKKSVRAPFAGRLGITTIRPGQYLAPGQKIVTLQSLEEIYADFRLPQQELARLQVGQKVDLSSNVWPDERFEGTITTIEPQVDPSTRNLLVQATLPNPGERLLPGMYAQVSVRAGEPEQRITIPRSAVTFNPYGNSVYLVERASGTDGDAPRVAKQVFVQLGPMRGDQVAILDGVKAGDVVVTSGQLKLHNGSEVRVDNSVQPTNEAAPRPSEN